MAVYTHLDRQQIEQHLSTYDIGELVSYKEIQEGIENSNFLIETTEDKFILTLFEKRVNPDELPYFVGIMKHLAVKGIACPLPIKNKDGEELLKLADKPALIVSFLNGHGARRIRNAHMKPLGGILAAMHSNIADFKLTRDNTMSLPEWKVLANSILADVDTIHGGLSELITDELKFLENNWPTKLPTGVIHADLFPDNVFYIESGMDVTLSGVIDFYFACNDFFMYDLAITMNAWCFERSNHHEFNITRTSRLLKGYNNIRTISKEELLALPILARGAALRFLLTRCYDLLNQPKDALVKTKDPMEYVYKLKFHQRVKNSREYGL